MNANPPINVALAAQRAKQTKNKIMQQMMRRQPAAGVGKGAAASGGGRSIFGGQNSRLPIPHMTRQSRLAPALIAALGMGAGIPDQAVGGLANGVQNNVMQQAQGIPDWAPQPDQSQPQAGGAATGASDPWAPYGGYGTAQDPSNPDQYVNNNGSTASTVDPGFGITPDQAGSNGLIHLGNGIYFDPSSGTLTGGGGRMRAS